MAGSADDLTASSAPSAVSCQVTVTAEFLLISAETTPPTAAASAAPAAMTGAEWRSRGDHLTDPSASAEPGLSHDAADLACPAA